MAYGQDKYRSRRNRLRVRRVLNEEWDPIGLEGDPEDEYDSYVAEVYVMVMDHHVAADAVAAYLLDIEERHMEMAPGDVGRAKRVAERLLDMRPSFEAESNEPF